MIKKYVINKKENINDKSTKNTTYNVDLSNILKLISVNVLILALIVSFVPSNEILAAEQNGAPEVIHQTLSSQILTKGAIHENIVKFTTQGWFNINLIKVDITSPYIKLNAITNSESIQNLTSVPVLAESSKAVGAINAGFFNWSKIPGLNSPIGPLVDDGTIVTSSSDFNRYSTSRATFSIDNLNSIFYEYWKTDIKLITPGGTSIPVERYNMQLNNNGDITVINRQWSTTSFGKADLSQKPSTPQANTFDDIAEVVVDNNIITDIRINQPPVEVPENGYIVVAANTKIKTLVDAFKVGDEINLEIITNPNWDNMSMAVTGGAIILKDGAIPSKFSHDSPGRHPRTAIGSSKDGKQVLMVTVDGRQQKSLGMTLTELANLMLELGAYNAINLDGGGSTTMAVRKPGTEIINIVNSPSDGMARRIANAAGVFSTAPSSHLAGLIIDTEDKNVFVNTSRAYTVRGYDSYFNPVSVNPEQVKWSVSGIEGEFKGNTFYPKSVGSGKIRASIGDVSGELEVNSLSSPVQLILSDKLISLQINATKRFNISGKNRNGYYAKINPEDITWSVSGNIGSFKQGVFTASNEGKGFVEAAVDDVKAYCGVKVSADTVVVVDNFEKINGSYLSYPENIPGKYELSSEQKRSGNYSGKLTYDFNDSTGSRASYWLLSDGGRELGKNVKKIGLWVYNNNPNPNWLRALVYDSKGGRHFIDITQNMDWTGWRYVETSVAGINPGPLTLARIYLVQIRDVPDAGHIYLDDLTFISVPDPTTEDILVPQDTKPIDEHDKQVDFKQGDNAFRFSVFSQSKEPSNPLENLLMRRLAIKLNISTDASAFIGSNSKNAGKKVKNPLVMAYNDLKSLDYKNSRFIQLDTRKPGIRISHSAQWRWFLTQLENFKGDNVFIFMENHPKTFSDTAEADLFQSILTEYRQRTGRNIWVFYKDATDSSYMERGIKYVSTAGFEVNGLAPENASQVKYVYVTVQGRDVNYQFKSIIPQ